ncbi:Fc.00g046250.m01.CDS01 [Cosmosporella sp. VM-42]
MTKSALLVLDLQKGLMDMFPSVTGVYLPKVAEAINEARAAGVKIIYLRTCFRRGHPEVSSRNLSFARIVDYGGAFEDDSSTEISASVAPIDGDVVIIKRRTSAFSGSDLDCVLRGLNIDSVVLTGVATSGAVLSTLRQAADLDYSLTVLEDLCIDPESDVHQLLVEKVFPKQGRVLTSGKWLQELKGKKN